MPRSSIQGVDPAPAQPPGRDSASLGPGDTSDSGSDLMGIDEDDGGDPGLPTDLAFDDDQPPRTLAPDTLEANSDAVGTGERRSAGADGGKPDGWDIGTDQVFTPDGAVPADDEDEHADLAFVDDAETGNPPTGDDENEADDAAPVRRATRPRH